MSYAGYETPAEVDVKKKWLIKIFQYFLKYDSSNNQFVFHEMKVSAYNKVNRNANFVILLKCSFKK